MLGLEMNNCDDGLAVKEQCNRYVLQHADTLWLQYVTPGGMLDQLVREPRRMN